MTERVVITGLGCLTAAGNTVDESWQSIKQGKTAIDKITAWDTSDWEFSLGAEIKQFDPKQFIDRKLLKLLSRHDVIGIAAANQAIQDSQLISYRDSLTDPTEFNEQTGIYVSSPGGKFNQQYDYFPLLTQTEYNMPKFGNELNNVVHPMWLLRNLPNNVLGHTAILHGFKGSNQNIVNHSVGGVQAILEASDVLRRGIIDRAVVIGYDSTIEPQTQMYYTALGVISKSGVKSFDHHRDGTVLAEGAGAIILETLTSAKKRGAKIYGEILGGTSSSEAMGVFAIREDGEGLREVIQETLQRAEISADNIGMITAHANGTVLSDQVEASVYSALFSEQVPVTGFKWAFGHTIAAAGVIEAIFTLLSLNENQVPGIHTLQQKAKECSKLSVSQSPQTLQKPTALMINRGFASINSCLAMQGAKSVC